jgi:hypothetical protein
MVTRAVRDPETAFEEITPVMPASMSGARAVA